jgi:hypothetical protein
MRKRPKASRHLALGVLIGVILATAPTHATAIQFAVDPALVGVVVSNQDVDLFSPDLNGTLMQGQALSLDLVLADDVLARFLLLHQLGIVLSIYTNAGTFPGDAGPTDGFVLDANGNQFGDTQVAGRGQSSDGSFSIGLSLLGPDDFGGASAADISGVHFDTTFPSTGFVVTNLRLRFALLDDRVVFGTAAQLPEHSTLLLLLLGIGTALFGRRRRDHRRCIPPEAS